MERLQIIEALKDLPDNVEAETAGLSQDVLRYQAAENEWSIKEIAGHLRDSAEVWHRRLYMTWSLTDPVLPSFDGEARVRDLGYRDADLGALIGDMRKWRLETVDLLKNAVDWTRIGQHMGMGRRSLKQLAEYMVEHEAEHLGSIRALKAARSESEPG